MGAGERVQREKRRRLESKAGRVNAMGTWSRSGTGRARGMPERSRQIKRAACYCQWTTDTCMRRVVGYMMRIWSPRLCPMPASHMSLQLKSCQEQALQGP